MTGNSSTRFIYQAKEIIDHSLLKNPDGSLYVTFSTPEEARVQFSCLHKAREELLQIKYSVGVEVSAEMADVRQKLEALHYLASVNNTGIESAVRPLEEMSEVLMKKYKLIAEFVDNYVTAINKAMASIKDYIWHREVEPPKQTGTDLAYAQSLLFLAEGDSLEMAENAYRAAMKQAHPDVGGSNAVARKLTWAIDTIRKHESLVHQRNR